MDPSNPEPVQGIPEGRDVIQLTINALDDELGTLGSDTIRQLRHSREQALESSQGLDRFNTLSNRSNLLSACASVAAVSLMLVLFLPANEMQTQHQNMGLVPSILPDPLNDEEVDFYGSVDFLLWLEQQRV